MKKFLIIIALPLAFTVIFGHIYEKNSVDNIPLTICDEDQTSTSRTLAEMYADSEKFLIISHVSTLDEVHEEIFSGRAKAALIIPKNFSREIKLGHGSEVSIIVNSANNMFGNATISAIQEINRTFSLGVAQKLFEGANLLPEAAMSTVYPIKPGVRILGNPTNGYSPFMLSGLILNGVQIGILAAFAPIFFEELKKTGSIGNFLPKFFVCQIFGLAGYILSLIVAIKFFALPMRGNWSEILILGVGFTFFVESVLMIFSICSPTHEMTIQAPMLYIMPGLLYSGLSFPTFDMSGAARFYSSLLPMTYAGDTLRDILLIGHAPNLFNDLKSMIFGGFFSVTVAIAIFFVRGGKFLEKNLPARN